MYRWHIFFAVTFFFFIPFFSHAEYIQLFDSDISVQKDSTLHVVETIEYVFTSEKHGIFRTIPLTHIHESSAWYKKRFIDVALESVEMDGTPVPYELTDEDSFFLKIGDPDQTIKGTHTYKIAYTVRGGLSYPKDAGAELYWDVTGFDWDVGMRNVRISLSAPEGLFTERRACYRGRLGDTGSCSKAILENGTVTFSAQNLDPQEGVTVAQGIDMKLVDKVVLEETNTIWFWGMSLLLWFCVLGYFVYRYKTAHKTGHPIIAQYEPYQDFKPMYAGLLIDGRLGPEDITAGIIYLAQQGFFKIKKTTGKALFFFEVDDYEITLQKSPNAIESRFQKELVKLLFGEKTSPGNTVTLNSLKKNFSKQKENHEILKNLKKELEKDLETSGFYQADIMHLILAGVFVLLVVVVGGTIAVYKHLGGGIALGVLFVGVSLAILGFTYRRRTRKGYEALDHLEGFSLFLSVTDKERFAFHDAPTKSPEQFMEYLPYAIAFGVEEEWASVFKDVTVPAPDWYEGGGGTNFSATSLSASLGAFSTAFTASAASTSSGSSGGGFAGGGVGGGGGGSW